MGGRLALPGSDGQCVFTHSIRGVDSAREVRAAWRALLLLDSEGAGDDAGKPDLIPFLNADIRTSFFSADVLKKCALPCT